MKEKYCSLTTRPRRCSSRPSTASGTQVFDASNPLVLLPVTQGFTGADPAEALVYDGARILHDNLPRLERALRETLDGVEAAVTAADAAPIEPVDTLLDHVTRPVDPTNDPGDPGSADPMVPGDPGPGNQDDVDEVWP